MNASADISDHLPVDHPARAAERFGTRLLLLNGVTLAAVSLPAAVADLAGYFLLVGPFAATHAGNPIAIGSFEAHGLALIVAVLLLAHRGAPGTAWHWTAAGTHVLLGAANLLFWPVYTRYGLVPAGIITTLAHAVFATLEVIAALWRRASRP